MSVREVCWDLPSEPEFIAKARTMVRETLGSWGLRTEIGDVELIVSELYTNAVVHGGPHITLTLRLAGPILSGAITDHSASAPALVRADAFAEHGRGLAIVDALADRWGIAPKTEESGKTVWFVIRSGRPS